MGANAGGVECRWPDMFLSIAVFAAPTVGRVITTSVVTGSGLVLARRAGAETRESDPMKVFRLLPELRVIVAPRRVATYGPIVLRWSYNHDKDPATGRVGIVADVGCWEFRTGDNFPGQTLPPAHPLRQITMLRAYAVRLVPGPQPGPLTLWHVHNHNPRDGSSVIGLEFAPGAFTVEPLFADEAGRCTNQPGKARAAS
jgi:hypothetical protein